jgi:membrane protease subunit HflK
MMKYPGQGGGGDEGGKIPDLEEVFKKAGDFSKGIKHKLPAFGVIIVIIVLIVLAIGSFYVVAPEELGVVKRFGKAVRTTQPGPHLKIPIIEKVLKPQVTKVHRLEIGFQTIDPGPPARYRPVKEEALMLTGDENIVAVEFIVQFRIKDPLALLFNVRDPGKTVKDSAEAAMREVVGKTPITDVLTEGRFQVQQKTKLLLQDILDRYDSGITIDTVQLQDVLPPEQVIAAFKDVASAREDREKAVEKAEGYKNDIIPKAKGGAEKIINEAMAYKEATINKAKGDTSRFLQVLREYRKAKDVTQKRIYIETMEVVLARMEKIIIEGNVQRNILPYIPLGRGSRSMEGGKK